MICCGSWRIRPVTRHPPQGTRLDDPHRSPHRPRPPVTQRRRRAFADITIRRRARTQPQENILAVLRAGKLVASRACPAPGSHRRLRNALRGRGQRRYVESLSAYARQFLGQMGEARTWTRSTGSAGDLDRQRTAGPEPALDGRDHSTEIYRLPCGPPVLAHRRKHCSELRARGQPADVQEMVDRVLALPRDAHPRFSRPLIVGRKRRVQEGARRPRAGRGICRARIDGVVRDLEGRRQDREEQETHDRESS